MLLRNKTPEHTYLHILNYDYRKRKDEMRPKSFSFSLKLPHRVKDARFLGESGEASVRAQGEVLNGEVKNIIHFGFVRVKNES